jgi:hypothetical protein
MIKAVARASIVILVCSLSFFCLSASVITATTVIVNNVAPSLSAVSLTDTTGTPATIIIPEKPYFANFTVQDNNSIWDLDYIIIKIFYDETTTPNKTNCYRFTYTQSDNEWVSNPTGYIVSNTTPVDLNLASFEFALGFKLDKDAFSSDSWHITINMVDDAGNNVSKTTMIAVKEMPDLTLNSSGISFSPTSPGEGDLVNITAMIHNIGGVDADNFTVSFFDGTFLIGNDTISVGANSNEIAMIEWTAVSGDREISVIVDSENKISESNETNNKASKVIYVRPISPCYIATATYGTPLDENINVLRDFRDAVLMTNPVGEAFVSTYYATSPPIADALRANEGLRTVTRLTLITPLVYLSEFALSGILLMFSIGLAVGILLRRDRMKILKSLLVGTGSILVFIAAIFSLGFAGHTIPFCAGIGAYLLPFVIPLSVIFTLCRVLNLNIVFITN